MLARSEGVPETAPVRRAYKAVDALIENEAAISQKMAKLKEGTQEYKNLAALLRETRRQIAEHDPNEYVGNYIQALAKIGRAHV